MLFFNACIFLYIYLFFKKRMPNKKKFHLKTPTFTWAFIVLNSVSHNPLAASHEPWTTRESRYSASLQQSQAQEQSRRDALRKGQSVLSSVLGNLRSEKMGNVGAARSAVAQEVGTPAPPLAKRCGFPWARHLTQAAPDELAVALHGW